MTDRTWMIPRRNPRNPRKPWAGLYVTVFPNRTGLRRLLQRAGANHPLSYRRGVCVRLPRGHVLMVLRDMRLPGRDPDAFTGRLRSTAQAVSRG